MRTHPHMSDQVAIVAQDVTDLALVALEPDRGRWDEETRLWVAESVWNAHSDGNPDPAAGLEIGEFGEGWIARFDVSALVARLAQVRRERWAHLMGFVFELEAQRVSGQLVVTFQLALEDEFHPCRVVRPEA